MVYGGVEEDRVVIRYKVGRVGEDGQLAVGDVLVDCQGVFVADDVVVAGEDKGGCGDLFGAARGMWGSSRSICVP